jgi:8-oxo-dGTP pyrophosphatase MutT (NUDIX family)
MEQRSVLSPGQGRVSAPAALLSRADLRARLNEQRDARNRGDFATAMRLMSEGSLEPFVQGGFGVVPTTGIPYAQAAGAPGVKVKRTPAAVLVPLVEHADGFTILFTQRNADLKHHAGQISFPGGRMEPDDASVEAAALREATEEIGLDPACVDILGRLESYLTITGYEVTPVVGAVAPPLELKLDPAEVTDVFEVPLSFFMDAANHHRVTRDYNGITRAYYAMPFGERYIWGATAGMLLNLYEVLIA